MGRYIYMGIATSYVAYTEHIEKELNEKTLKEVQLQLSPDIYEFSRYSDRLEWTMRKDIPISELITVIRSFADIYQRIDEKDLHSLLEKLSSMNIEKAIEFAEDREYTCFQTFDLDAYLYYYPFMINGRERFVNTAVSTIIIADSCFKTLSEDDICPYDFFTELLRYRLKPLRLADSFLVYLSQ